MTRVLCESPRARARAAGDPARLGIAIREPYSPEQYLELGALRAKTRTLSEICRCAVSIRTARASVGSHRYPEPASFPRLLSLANREITREPSTEVRIGLVGLLLVVVHPLADGNGRLARLAWLHGLFSIHCSLATCARVVSDLVGPRGLGIDSQLLSADCGDLSPFIQRWRQVLSD